MPKGVYKRTKKHLSTMRKNGFQKGHLINLGEKSPNWKGEKASYTAHHHWIRKNKPPPDRCVQCGKIGKVHAANISGKYKRDFADWEYLCARCHNYKDGTIKNLKHDSKTQKERSQKRWST